MGEDFLWSYHLCLASGVCGPGASQPGQAAVRETWVSQVASSVPSHTLTAQAAGTSWLFFSKARDSEFRHWNPPSLAAHLSQVKGQGLSERTASCLLPGRGAERVT